MLDGVVDVVLDRRVLVPLAPADAGAGLAPRDNPAALVRLFPVLRRVNKLADLVRAESTPPADPSASCAAAALHALRHAARAASRDYRPLCAIFIDDAALGRRRQRRHLSPS